MLRSNPLFLAFGLAAALTSTPVSAQVVTVDTLSWTGPTANRINIVFLGDGYTAQELDRFSDWSRDAFDSLFLNSKNPTRFYVDHKSMFNAFAIRTASTQSGVSHPSSGINKSTFYGCSFGGNWTTGSCNRNKAMQTAAKYLPEYSAMIMVFNDQGGLRATGGDPIYLPEGDYIHVVKHELGHNLADLGDEYEEAGRTGDCGETPNTTAETRREFIKWSRWILPATPIPSLTAIKTTTGLFEGANYQSSGCYRPEYDCLMRSYTGYDNGKLVQFCRPCAEEMIVKAYQTVSPIDSSLPAPGTVTVALHEHREFRVKPLAVPTIAVSWIVDGVAAPGAVSPTFALPDLAAGNHTLAAIVRDTTSAVRKMTYVLADTARWTVRVDAITSLARSGSGMVGGFEYSGRRLSLDLEQPGRVTIRRMNALGRTGRALAASESRPAGKAAWAVPAGGILSVTVTPAEGGGPVFHKILGPSPSR